MLILGVLALGQMAFIPGWLFLKVLKFETSGALQTIIYSLGLSLLLNYGLVAGLTACHLYTSAAMYLVLMVEGVLLLGRFKPGPKRTLDLTCQGPDLSMGGTILFILTAMAIAAFVYYAAVNAGEVFRLFDAVVSWNRWAVDWAHNTFPYKTAQYPQLIPANWSLAYVIIKNYDVQIFARALMPLFPLAIMLLFLDWSFKWRNQAGMAAILFYSLIMLYFYQPAAMIDGYVDIAVSFLGLLVCYSIYNWPAKGLCWKQMLLTGLFAAAAALTKQAGIFVLVTFAGWSLWFILKNFSSARDKALKCLGSLLAVIIIVGTWYVAKELQIARGMDYSAIQLVTHDIYGGASLPQRMVNAAGLLVNARGDAGFPIFMVLWAAFAVGLSCRRNLVLGLLSITYLVLWGLFFSYDTRNLTLIYPVLALIMARGVIFLLAGPWSSRRGWLLIIVTIILAGFTSLGAFPKHLGEPSNLWYWGLIASMMVGAGLALILVKRGKLILPQPLFLLTGLAVVIWVGSYYYTPQVLIESQLRKQEQLGIAGLNHLIYKYERQQGIKGRILSDYIFLPFLPDLREKTVYRQWPEGIYSALQQKPDIGALLISNTTLAEEDINKEASERFARVFSYGGYTFLTKRY